MMRRSLLTILLVLIATTSLAAPLPVNPADAIAFMNQLWNRAVELLNNKTDPAIRQARFRQLFHDDFDGAGIARFVLGRYWRSAGAEEQQEFVKLFENYVAFVYSARLANLALCVVGVDSPGCQHLDALELTVVRRVVSSSRATKDVDGIVVP